MYRAGDSWKKSSEGFEDLFGASGPDKGLGLSFHTLAYVRMSASRAWTLV